MKVGLHISSIVTDAVWPPGSRWHAVRPTYRRLIDEEEFLRVASELKVDSVEVEGNFMTDMSDKYLEHFKEMIDSRGLHVSSVNVQLNFLAPGQFDGQVELVKKWAEKAAMFDSHVLGTHAATKPPGMSSREAFELERKGIEECLPTLEDLDVVFAPESSPGQSSQDLCAVLTLLKIIDSKYFGYTFDTGLVPQNEQKYMWAELLAPYIVHFHAKDRQLHWKSGESVDNDYRRLISILKTAGYDGYLDVEWVGGATTTKEELRSNMAKMVDLLRKYAS